MVSRIWKYGGCCLSDKNWFSGTLESPSTSGFKRDRLEALLTLAVAAGMWRGELLALRWANLNLEEGSLRVRRSADRVGKHSLVENGPKTVSGQRKNPVTSIRAHCAVTVSRVAS
jgi:integrase